MGQITKRIFIFVFYFLSIFALVFFVFRTIVFVKEKYTNIKVVNSPEQEKFLKKEGFFTRMREELLKPIIVDEIRRHILKQKTIARFAEEIFPPIVLDVLENKMGVGSRVFCGQSVKVSLYGYTDRPYQVFQQKRNGIVIMKIGENSITKGIDLAVSGMKIGGERTVRVPESMPMREDVYKILRPNKKYFFYDLVLLDVLSFNHLNIDELIIERKIDSLNQIALCGDTVLFDIKIARMNNEIIYEKNNIETKLGEFAMPIAVELGLEKSMISNLSRVVAPIEFMVDGNEKYLIDFPKNEKFIIYLWPKKILSFS